MPETDEPQGYWIHLTRSDGAEREVTALSSIDVTREHTAMSDWQAEVPADVSLEEWVFSQADIYYGSNFIFRGELEAVETDEVAGSTTLSGRDVIKELLGVETEVAFENRETWDAIQEVWDEHTPFEATVHEPEPAATGVEDRLHEPQSTEEYQDIISIPPNTPGLIEDATIKPLQASHWRDATDSTGDGSSISGDDYTGGQAIELDSQGQTRAWEVPGYEYEMAQHQASLAVRLEALGTGDQDSLELTWSVDGTQVSERTFTPVEGLHWHLVDVGMTLDADEAIPIEVSTDDGGGENIGIAIDSVALLDGEHIPGPPEDAEVDDNQALAWPPDYPEELHLEFDVADTDLNIDRALITSTWDDTSNSQAIAVSADGGDTWLEETNTDALNQVIEVATNTITARVTLSNYGTQASTPTQGIEGQEVTDWMMEIIGSEQSVIDEQSFEGDLLRILQEMHSFGGMRFTAIHDPDKKLVESYATGQEVRDATFEVVASTRLVDVEDYFNRVVVKGAKLDDGSGDRHKGEAQDRGAQQAVGFTRTKTLILPDLDTDEDCRLRAQTELASTLGEDEVTGSQEIIPTLVNPGFAYEVPRWGATLSMEQVSYQEAFQEVSATVEWEADGGIASEVTGLKGDTSRLEGVL